MAEMSDVAMRLKQYLKSVGLSVRQFEQKCEFANGWVGNIKEQIRIQALVTIGFHYPDLNLNWLLLGHGQMLNEGYRPEDLPTTPVPGYQDVSPKQGFKPVSKYNIHDNHNVNVESMQTEIEFLRHQIEVKDELVKQLQAEKAEYWEMIKNFTK